MRSAAVLVAAIVALSSCGGVPTTSDVKFTDDAPGASAAQYIRVIARPPSDGMDQLEVVRGFLEACADPANDYEVARQYLSSDTAAQWNPATGVQVYDATALRVTQSASDVVVAAPVQAVITADRRFSVLAATSSVKQRLRLDKDGAGQWRISELPDGLLLSMGDVDRTFRPWVVYYVAKDLSQLVTDTIVLPVAMQGTATALVQALLAPPPADVSVVADTAFPPGTRLTFGSVPITNGVAEVDLSSDVLSADRSVRRALTAQLVYTLQQLATVGGVRLSVSGQQLTVPGISGITKASDWPTYSPSTSAGVLYTATAKGVQRITPVDSTQVAAKPGDVAGQISQLSVDPIAGRIAIVSGGGTQLATTADETGALTVRHVGASLTKPSWDRDGTVYVADFGTGVTAVPLTGKPVRVVLGRTSVGAVEQVKQVAVGPDGVRIAAVLSVGTSDILTLGSVTHTKAATSIVGLRRVDRGLGVIKDVVWSGQSTVVALVSDAAGGSLVSVNVANGSAIASAAPAGAQSLGVDASGSVYVVVADTKHSTVVKRGYGQWADVAAGTAVAFGP